MAHRLPRPRCVRRAAVAVLGSCAGSVLLLAGPASAHVRVFSDGASEGHAATLRFRVPAEKPSVTTVRIEVTLPAGVRPVSYPAVPGWTHTQRSVGTTTHVVWTATAGHEIKPDDHRYFPVRVGPLPHRPSLGFDTVQTYSDGSVVDWNQPTTGDGEPDFPSPQLVLDAAVVRAQQGKAREEAAPTPSSPAPSVSATAATSAAGSATAEGGTSWVPWAVVGAAVVATGAVVGNRRRGPGGRGGGRRSGAADR
ncbi:DUF1775 domain-containing protein [Streptomyces sp. TG1A-8]|uniref:DUF1775 domain-containing protein n=1 Tax=Streptomyces sp. TG1A-8 TaxID=3051385 RepID=UPI00265C16C8|nr:DUF1775 domain-containing protein [Streptomyces sp. TG1A-8]MDO0924023.1 DUF1775 domain-containing protein [Streptomyces sp. TG1A-8]